MSQVPVLNGPVTSYTSYTPMTASQQMRGEMELKISVKGTIIVTKINGVIELALQRADH